MGGMRRGAKVWPAGILELGDLAEGFKWVACVGESEFTHDNMRNFSVNDLRLMSRLGAIMWRAATAHSGPFLCFQIEW